VCGSVRFRPEQICAVTDSVSEQQPSVRSISNIGTSSDMVPKCPDISAPRQFGTGRELPHLQIE